MYLLLLYLLVLQTVKIASSLTCECYTATNETLCNGNNCDGDACFLVNSVAVVDGNHTKRLAAGCLNRTTESFRNGCFKRDQFTVCACNSSNLCNNVRASADGFQFGNFSIEIPLNFLPTFDGEQSVSTDSNIVTSSGFSSDLTHSNAYQSTSSVAESVTVDNWSDQRQPNETEVSTATVWNSVSTTPLEATESSVDNVTLPSIVASESVFELESKPSKSTSYEEESVASQSPTTELPLAGNSHSYSNAAVEEFVQTQNSAFTEVEEITTETSMAVEYVSFTTTLSNKIETDRVNTASDEVSSSTMPSYASSSKTSEFLYENVAMPSEEEQSFNPSVVPYPVDSLINSEPDNATSLGNADATQILTNTIQPNVDDNHSSINVEEFSTVENLKQFGISEAINPVTAESIWGSDAMVNGEGVSNLKIPLNINNSTTLEASVQSSLPDLPTLTTENLDESTFFTAATEQADEQKQQKEIYSTLNESYQTDKLTESVPTIKTTEQSSSDTTINGIIFSNSLEGTSESATESSVAENLEFEAVASEETIAATTLTPLLTIPTSEIISPLLVTMESASTTTEKTAVTVTTTTPITTMTMTTGMFTAKMETSPETTTAVAIIAVASSEKSSTVATELTAAYTTTTQLLTTTTGELTSSLEITTAIPTSMTYATFTELQYLNLLSDRVNTASDEVGFSTMSSSSKTSGFLYEDVPSEEEQSFNPSVMPYSENTMTDSEQDHTAFLGNSDVTQMSTNMKLSSDRINTASDEVSSSTMPSYASSSKTSEFLYENVAMPSEEEQSFNPSVVPYPVDSLINSEPDNATSLGNADATQILTNTIQPNVDDNHSSINVEEFSTVENLKQFGISEAINPVTAESSWKGNTVSARPSVFTTEVEITNFSTDDGRISSFQTANASLLEATVADSPSSKAVITVTEAQTSDLSTQQTNKSEDGYS
uniref:EB domain-containing protein n=1 Tax=Syphacia muris TaxID=451379 RepID=A0A0N5ARJ4_9BILA